MRKQRNMPKQEDIFIYWAKTLMLEHGKYWLDAVFDEMTHLSECATGDEVISRSDAKKVKHICFACGFDGGTQRCHIVPKCIGGADSVENLHLLCKYCHSESEYIENVDAYFFWFAKKNPLSSFGTKLRTERALQIQDLIASGQTHLIEESLRIKLKSVGYLN
jgi:hypothetical protein